MITPQLGLSLHDEIFIDNFAGGGGASTGIERALRRAIDHALNHNRKALSMHRMNHPTTKHHREDIRHADPLKIAGDRRVGGIWFSPDCTHHSKARGGKPKDKKIRGLAWSVVHWVNVLKSRSVGGAPRVLYLENVEEFENWCPLNANNDPSPWRAKWFFRCFTGALFRRGYTDLEWSPGDGHVYRRTWAGIERVPDVTFSSRACDYSAPTIRRRLYLVARCDGGQVVWPKPTHAAPAVARAKKRKPWRTMAECINFNHPCPSIFISRAEAKLCGWKVQRPLKPATLARIAKGVDRYVLKAKKPFIVELTHEGNNGVQGVGEPVKTVTGANRGEKALVVPTISTFYGAKREGDARGSEVSKPLATQPTANRHAVVEATLAAPFVSHAQHGGAARPVESPIHTIAASEKDQNQVIVPYLVPRYGERPAKDGSPRQEPRTMPVDAPGPVVVPTGNGGSLAAVSLAHIAHGEVDKRGKKRGRGGFDVREPSPAVLASNDVATVAASIVKMRGNPDSHAPGHPVPEPGHTISAQGTHHGLVAAYVAQHNGGEKGHQTYGHPVTKPISTLSAKCSQQQLVGAAVVPYYGSEKDANTVAEPARTVTTRDRFGLVQADGSVRPLTPELEVGARRVAKFLRDHGVVFDGEFATVGEYIIVDIGMRMLKPRELYNAQGFPVNYIIDRGLDEDDHGRLFEIPLNGTDQVKMCGNSVSPPMAEAIVAANNPEMRVERLAA